MVPVFSRANLDPSFRLVVREWSVGGLSKRSLLEFRDHDLDRFLELRVATAPPDLRTEIDIDIRRYALVLDIELTL